MLSVEYRREVLIGVARPISTGLKALVCSKAGFQTAQPSCLPRPGNVCTGFVYTITLLDGLKGFDWDLHNVSHVARHGVNPTEVEEAAERPHVVIPAKDMRGEKRWKLFGRS